MGFTLENDRESKACLKFDGTGDPVSSFVEGVKRCLSLRIIEIEVDLGAYNQIIGPLVDPILKLQKVLQPRGQTLVIRFSGSIEESVSGALRNAGVQIMSFAGDAPGRWNLQSITSVLEKSQKDQDLPEFSELESEFKARREELAALLKSEDDLNGELQDLKSRLQTVSKGLSGSSKSLNELKELTATEAEVQDLRNQIQGLRKEATDAKDKSTEAQKANAEFVKRVDQENAKKLEVAKKQLNTLKSDLDKKTKEFEKRSEARRQELKKRAPATGGGM